MRGFSPKVPRPSTAYSIQHSKRIVYPLFCIHKKLTCPKNALSVYAVRICKRSVRQRADLLRIWIDGGEPYAAECIPDRRASRTAAVLMRRVLKPPEGRVKSRALRKASAVIVRRRRVSVRANRRRPHAAVPGSQIPDVGVDSCVFRSAFSPFGFNNTISSEYYISSRTPYTLPKSKRTLRPKPL